MHSVYFIQLTPMGLGKQTEIEIIDKKHLCTGINETEVFLICGLPSSFFLLAKFSIWIPYSWTHACRVYIHVTVLMCQTDFKKCFPFKTYYIYLCVLGRCEWVHTHHNVCAEVRRQLVEVSSLPLPQKPWRGDSSFPAWHQVWFSVEATRHSLSYLDSPLSLRLAPHFLVQVQSQTHSRSLHIHEIKWFIFIHLLPFSL